MRKWLTDYLHEEYSVSLHLLYVYGIYNFGVFLVQKKTEVVMMFL